MAAIHAHLSCPQDDADPYPTQLDQRIGLTWWIGLSTHTTHTKANMTG